MGGELEKECKGKRKINCMWHPAFLAHLTPEKLIALYVGLVSVVGLVLTCYDKVVSKRSGRRVPERVLLIIGAAGGALIMYLTMRLIHHKTRHKKFMVGLPLLILLHCILLVMFVYVSIK